MRTKQHFSLLYFPSIMVMVLAALAGCGKKETPSQQQGPVEVGVIILQPKAVDFSRELPARTSAYRVADIRPQVSGIVVKRLFEEGGAVKAGQALYQIDPDFYRASYEQAAATLAKEEALLKATELKAKRYADLVTINAVSQQENDDVQSAFQQGTAAVAVAKAALTVARINLGYSRVTSPVTGLIGKSSVTEGALVTTNQLTALATVQQLDPMYVDVTQPSAEVSDLKNMLARGEYKKSANTLKVYLTLEDGSKYAEVGKLQFTDVTVTQATGSILLRALFPNPKHELLPGMFVRAHLIEASDPNAILLPQKAVMRTPKGEATVMLVDSQSKAMLRTIKVGRSVGNEWLVEDGVAAGDHIIVDNLMKVQPGILVKPILSDPDSAPAQQQH